MDAVSAPCRRIARHCESRYLAPRPTLRRARSPAVWSPVRSAVVGWREHAHWQTSSQSLHHGHTFPAARVCVALPIAGDAGVAGTEPDKPGERDGKAGSDARRTHYPQSGADSKPPLRRPQAWPAITGETGAGKIHAALRDPTGLRRGRRILASRPGRTRLGPECDFRALG